MRGAGRAPGHSSGGLLLVQATSEGARVCGGRAQTCTFGVGLGLWNWRSTS